MFLNQYAVIQQPEPNMKEELEEIGVPTDYVTSQYPNDLHVDDLNLNVELRTTDLISDHETILNNLIKLIMVIRGLKTDLAELNTIGMLKNMLDEENDKLKADMATKEQEMAEQITQVKISLEENVQENTELHTQI